jgi:hypothetical protein
MNEEYGIETISARADTEDWKVTYSLRYVNTNEGPKSPFLFSTQGLGKEDIDEKKFASEEELNRYAVVHKFPPIFKTNPPDKPISLDNGWL